MGGALRFGGGPVRLLGEGRLGPAKACCARFPLFASGRPLYDIHLKQFNGGSALKIKAASPCKHAGRTKLADDACVLVNLPPSLFPVRVFYDFNQTVLSP